MHSRACARNASSPSFRLMELTMPLPCTHFRPASITDHLEESIMTGTRAMSGSPAIRLRNLTMAACESSMPSSMLTSMICAPLATCWRAMSTAAGIVARLDQLAELGRAGHVGALADIDEQAVGIDGQRLQAAQAAGRGDARHACAAATPATARTTARMCSGVVPQQPPTMLTKPLAANSRKIAAVCSRPSRRIRRRHWAVRHSDRRRRRYRRCARVPRCRAAAACRRARN